MATCIIIILHNMIVEDERDNYGVQNDESFDYEQCSFTVSQSYNSSNVSSFIHMCPVYSTIFLFIDTFPPHTYNIMIYYYDSLHSIK
ncbi:hypothetical protein BDA99DRAFT_527380 [Phascolomyces articulosus]|uniref:Uncharacterized protein n=1 Tax=Phascolomyces articulosus TaxID=60185 RepID=A0AAD5JNC4_9FUNG|nr:hypothetical protein BDA99DRAFT_527380 [Phascolomyces articulosus]